MSLDKLNIGLSKAPQLSCFSANRGLLHVMSLLLILCLVLFTLLWRNLSSQSRAEETFLKFSEDPQNSGNFMNSFLEETSWSW